METKINLICLVFCVGFTSVLSIGNLLLSSGPSCAVSTLIPGSPNQSVQTMKGTCYSSLICRQQQGVPIGRCGVSNVCCVFPRSCGGIAAHNSTYFTNPGYPSSYNRTNTCSLTIHRIPGVNRICQLRIDFMDFELVQPNSNGDCDADRFLVSGQNLNSIVPQICGFNSGHHMYVDIDGVQGPIILNVRTEGPGNRRWNILVSQIECNNPIKAPPNCLQYFLGPTGDIMSFNYELLQQTNINTVNELVNSNQAQLSDIPSRGIGYMNNMDYSMCFRKEQYFCTQTYTVNNASGGQLQSLNDQAFSIASTVNTGNAGAGLTRCPDDYLLLDGVRLCGYRLNSRAFSGDVRNNEPITDNGSGPFIARFVSNDRQIARGFKLSYRQNPCISLIQSPQTAQGRAPEKRRYYSGIRSPQREVDSNGTLTQDIIQINLMVGTDD